MFNSEFLVTLKLSHLLSTDIGISGDEATIIDAIYYSQKAIISGNLRRTILDLYHIDIDQSRLDSTIKRLINSNKLYRADDKLVISPQTMEDINKVILSNEQIEHTALNQWIKQFEGIETVELSEDIEKLRQCILLFIRSFFLTHGADCYNFIVGNKESTYFDIESIAKDSAKNIGWDNLEKLNHFLISIFSSEITAEQKAFLLAQLKKAVHYLSMVVDNSTKAALISQLDKVTVYLDTTILYRLFNLQGERRYLSTKSLIDFCQKSNIKLKVFQTTVDEMKRRIEYDARIIIKFPTPVSFSSIGYKCRTSENYISTFWREQSESGVSAKDFNFRYKNILALLQEHRIEVDERDYLAEYNLDSMRTNFYNKIVQFDSNDPEYQKSANAINHDAECLSIIEQLQIKNAANAIESKTFFLSSDWCLIRLQRYDHEYKKKTDMVVLPSQLMQIFCMTSSTIDYYDAFLGLFSSSHSLFGTSTLSNSQIQEILGRVAIYKGTTPAFAQRVLANQLIQSSFAEKETDEERNELIEDIMIAEVEQMEATIENQDVELLEKDKCIEKVKDESANKDDKIDELFKRMEVLEGKHTESSQELIIANKQILAYKEVLDKQVLLRSRIKAGARFVGGCLLLGLGILGIALSIFALLPITSSLVSPCFSWINSSETIRGTQNSPIDIIAYIATISIASVSAGVIFAKPGYVKLFQNYYTSGRQKLNKVDIQ